MRAGALWVKVQGWCNDDGYAGARDDDRAG